MTTKEFYFAKMNHIAAQVQRSDKSEDWKFSRGYTVKAYEEYKRLYESEPAGVKC